MDLRKTNGDVAMRGNRQRRRNSLSSSEPDLRRRGRKVNFRAGKFPRTRHGSAVSALSASGEHHDAHEKTGEQDQSFHPFDFLVGGEG